MRPPFSVRTAGFVDGNSESQKNHSSYSTKQKDATVRYFISGKGRCIGGTTEFILSPNTVVVALPEDDSVIMSDPLEPYTHYYCRFNGNYALYLAREIVDQYQSIHFAVPDAQAMISIMRQMEPIRSEQYRYELPREMGHNEILLMRLLILLKETDRVGNMSEKLDRETLENYLLEHISEPTDLSRIAEHFHVSKTTLVRSARRLHGMSVLQLHEKLKMDWAEKLLSLPGISVSETAYKTGYQDPLYFSRVFKKHHQCPPKVWKNGR